jgi:hypothetical protein
LPVARPDGAEAVVAPLEPRLELLGLEPAPVRLVAVSQPLAALLDTPGASACPAGRSGAAAASTTLQSGRSRTGKRSSSRWTSILGCPFDGRP